MLDDFSQIILYVSDKISVAMAALQVYLSHYKIVVSGKVDVVRLLISRGADGSLKDSYGRTALHRAAENGSPELCQMIITAYPELTTESDNRGKGPVHYATDPDLISLLTAT